MQDNKNTLSEHQDELDDSSLTTRSSKQTSVATPIIKARIASVSLLITDDNLLGKYGPKNPDTSDEDGGANFDGDKLHLDKLEATKEINTNDRFLGESSTLLTRSDQENDRNSANSQKLSLVKTSNIPKVNASALQKLPSSQDVNTFVQGTPLRFSVIPPPPLTDLEFWGILAKDYDSTCKFLPTLVTKKLRNGIPAPLRGVIWQSISNARNSVLESHYETLSKDLIFKRSSLRTHPWRIFPGVDMFRDSQGDGQFMLRRIIKLFGLCYNTNDYSHGLAFIVGPLLLNMGEKQTFCVLIRLIENYDMGTCFLPDSSNLHLRVYQYTQLLKKHFPNLSQHLETLEIKPTYILQWFLSFFAVTCPLHLLVRLYDVLFNEGALITIMRVALSLIQKNESKIMALKDSEEVTKLLLSRKMWDAYNYNADQFVNEFVNFSDVITLEVLQELEDNYNELQSSEAATLSKSYILEADKLLFKQYASSDILKGCLEETSSIPLMNLVRGSLSKHSSASSVNYTDDAGSISILSSSTDLTSTSGDSTNIDDRSTSLQWQKTLSKNNSTGEVHELLKVLSELREKSAKDSKELEIEKEKRRDDREAVKNLLDKLRNNPDIGSENRQIISSNGFDEHIGSYLERIESLFLIYSGQISSLRQIKVQLQGELSFVKKQLEAESLKTEEFNKQFLDQGQGIKMLQEQIKEVHMHIRHSHNENQKLKRVILELRKERHVNHQTRNSSEGEVPNNLGYDTTGLHDLRKFKLGHQSPNKLPLVSPSIHTTIPKTKEKLALGNKNPVSPKLNLKIITESETKNQSENEELIVELVKAKTAEAMAREEVEDLRTQLEILKKTVLTQSPKDILAPESTESNSTDNSLIFELVQAKTAEAMAREEVEDLRTQLEILKKTSITQSPKDILAPKSIISNTVNNSLTLGIGNYFSNSSKPKSESEASFSESKLKTEAPAEPESTSTNLFSGFGRFVGQKSKLEASAEHDNELKLQPDSKASPESKTKQSHDSNTSDTLLSKSSRSTSQKLETGNIKTESKPSPESTSSDTPLSRFGRFASQKFDEVSTTFVSIPVPNTESISVPSAKSNSEVISVTDSSKNLNVINSSTRGLASYFTSSKTGTKLPGPSEVTPMPNQETKSEPIQSAINTSATDNPLARGLASYFTSTKTETETPLTSISTPASKPAVATGGAGFWGGWGKKLLVPANS